MTDDIEHLPITLDYYSTVMDSPGWGLCKEAEAVIARDMLSPMTGQYGVSYANHCVVATAHLDHASAPIGIITVSEGEPVQVWYVGVGYVLPGYRRKGLYMKMWEFLLHMAARRNIYKIYSGILPTNAPMIAFSEKVGRQLDYLYYAYDVTPNQPHARSEGTLTFALNNNS